MASGKQNSYEIDMIHGPLMPGLIRFFIPLMLSGILQLLFNAVDLVVVGRWAGSHALAAVGATVSLVHVFCNLLIGISIGANVIAARFVAQEDEPGVSRTVHTSMLTGTLMGILVMVLGLMFTRKSLLLLGTPPDVLEDAVLYMRLMFVGVPFLSIYNYGAALLRACGDTRRPLYYLIVSGVLNAVLNMILVIGFGLDVAGVAIATVFSQFVSGVLIWRCLMRSANAFKLEFRKLSLDFAILKQILIIGIPAGLQSTVINISNAMLQSSVNSFGSIAMAGYTAANNVLSFLYVSVNAVTQGCVSFTSQNYAIDDPVRVKRVLRCCLFLECVVGGALGAVFFVFERQILGFYTDSAEAIDAGCKIFLYTLLTYFLCGIMDCLPGAIRGMGRSTAPMIFSIVGTVGFRIVWIYGVFPHHRTLEFLFITYPASWVLTIIMQTLCLLAIYRTWNRERKLRGV